MTYTNIEDRHDNVKVLYYDKGRVKHVESFVYNNLLSMLWSIAKTHVSHIYDTQWVSLILLYVDEIICLQYYREFVRMGLIEKDFYHHFPPLIKIIKCSKTKHKTFSFGKNVLSAELNSTILRTYFATTKQ